LEGGGTDEKKIHCATDTGEFSSSPMLIASERGHYPV